MGIEKVFDLTSKWNVGTGIDIVFNNTNDYASNNYQTVDEVNNSTTTTVATNFGGGLFGKVNYHLSKKILMGTECSYYYVTGKNNQTVNTEQYFTGNPPVYTQTKSNPNYSRGNISLPIVIYLFYKF